MRKRRGARLVLLLVASEIGCAGNVFAQDSQDSRTSKTQQMPISDNPSVAAKKSEEPKAKHLFWDKQNDWLFAGVGAARTLDCFSTLNMRRRGRQEIFLTNDVVDNHAAFATIEAATTGVSIAGAYLFHHYGHHKLERWTSIVHISLATTGAVRNYCLKTAHPTPTAASP